MHNNNSWIKNLHVQIIVKDIFIYIYSFLFSYY